MMYKNRDRYYRMVKPVGSFDVDGRRHYALWQRVWKWWCPWPIEERFWLDMYGFKKARFGKPLQRGKGGNYEGL